MTTRSDDTATVAARPRAGSAALVLVLALGVALAWTWWSHPRALPGHGNEIGGPARVGETANIGQGTGPAGESVRLLSVEPVVVTNTADARLEVVVCRDRGTPILSSSGSLEPDCSEVVPAEGAVLDDSGSESIIVRVTGRTAGRVVIDGVEVTYRRGVAHLWQTGTQRTGIDTVIEVGGPAVETS